MKILVTGSEGNIGKKLVPYLKEKGHTIYRNDIVSGIGEDYYQGDVCGSDLLYKKFENIEVVFHLAAMVSRVTCEATENLSIHTNICGTNNICQLCKMIGAYLINFSTSEVYGNVSYEMNPSNFCYPNNRYALSKYMAEKIVEYEVFNHDLKAVNIRPFMIYDEDESFGEHRSAMIRFAESLLKKQSIIVHSGAKRGWLHISNAIDILEKVAMVGIKGTMNIGNDEIVSIDSIAKKMCNYLDLEPEKYIVYRNLPIRMTLEKRPDLSIQKQLGDINYVSIEEGIKRVIEKAKKRI